MFRWIVGYTPHWTACKLWAISTPPTSAYGRGRDRATMAGADIPAPSCPVAPWQRVRHQGQEPHWTSSCLNPYSKVTISNNS